MLTYCTKGGTSGLSDAWNINFLSHENSVVAETRFDRVQMISVRGQRWCV